MANTATVIRIFNANPSDDFVEKRNAAIKELSDKLKKRCNFNEILQTADDLVAAMSAKASMPENLAAQVVAALQKQSPSFVREGENMQMLVCAFAAAHSALEGAQPSAAAYSALDLLAVALWLGLSFQPARSEARLEALRFDLLELTRGLISRSALSGRKRQPVPDFSVTLGEEELTGFSEKFNAGTLRAIDALRTNAALDREELDLLWWVLENWSTLLERDFGKADAPSAALAAGIEAGKLLRRLPAEAHKHIVLRNISRVKEFSLTDLLTAIGADRQRLVAAYPDETIITAYPHIFSLLSALATGKAKGSAAKIKRPLCDWASRALVESAILHLKIISPANAIC